MQLHKNPLRRVIHADLISEGKEHDYDKEKHCEMLFEAAEIVLVYFGFNRTLYGDTTRKNNRKWWYELVQERITDMEIERIVQDR